MTPRNINAHRVSPHQANPGQVSHGLAVRDGGADRILRVRRMLAGLGFRSHVGFRAAPAAPFRSLADCGKVIALRLD